MSFTIEQVECPICFDCIGEKNNITTECGHKFHASCLMANISRNGFDCPCCRTVMAKEEDNDDDETATLIDGYQEPFSHDALRGLGLLTDLMEGNEHDQEDVIAEHQYIAEAEEEEEEVVAPPCNFVESKLREEGVTYEELVALLLIDHEEYGDQEVELDRTSNNLWGKLRTIISNYSAAEQSPEPEAVPELEDKVFEWVENPSENELMLSPSQNVPMNEEYTCCYNVEGTFVIDLSAAMMAEA